MYKTVIDLGNGKVASQTYATGQEAWDARDRAYDAGFTQIRVEGAPTVIAGADGFRCELR
jgi:hypothetical protein